MKRIKKGDEVVVIAGKDLGRRGRVLMVDPVRGRAKVERINLVKRHVKPSQRNPQGGIVEREGTIHLSNLQPWDSKAQGGCRLGVERREQGGKVRVSRKSGEVLD